MQKRSYIRWCTCRTLLGTFTVMDRNGRCVILSIYSSMSTSTPPQKNYRSFSVRWVYVRRAYNLAHVYTADCSLNLSRGRVRTSRGTASIICAQRAGSTAKLCTATLYTVSLDGNSVDSDRSIILTDSMSVVSKLQRMRIN
jgi:hypothetical protein